MLSMEQPKKGLRRIDKMWIAFAREINTTIHSLYKQ
jgi:hypothetical protein